MKFIKEKCFEDIKNGYTVDKHKKYCCNYCGAVFEDGEIFPIDGHFYRAEKAVQIHIQKEHQSVFEKLLQLDKKESGMTEVQKTLLQCIYEGKNDKEIAAITNTSASTVRHQRFVFREKARQAKIFLALYELAIEKMEEYQGGLCENVLQEEKQESALEENKGE